VRFIVWLPERVVSMETTQCWPEKSTGRLSSVLRMKSVLRLMTLGAPAVIATCLKSNCRRHMGAGMAQQIWFEPPQLGGTLKVAPVGSSLGMTVGPFCDRN